MKVLLVTSSVRDGRVADKVLSYVQEELKNYPDIEVSVADFKQNPLPFFDSALNPSNPDFKPTDANVITWGKQVAEADAVIILEAEYNHSYTAVIKNAIDWLYPEWKDKPIGLIGYGWAGGSRATKHLRDILTSNIDAKPLAIEANLHFKQEIELDGSLLDEAKVRESINGVLQAAIEAVTEAEALA